MIHFLIPSPIDPQSAPLVALAGACEAKPGIVVECVVPRDLAPRLRALSTDDPAAVIAIHTSYLATLGTPGWLREVPALCATRLVVDSPLQDTAATRAWAAAVDHLIALPGTLPERLEREFTAHLVAADDATGLLEAARAPAATSLPAVEQHAQCELPTEFGTFDLRVYRVDGEEHAMVISMGELTGTPPFVRVHSECFTGEVLASLKCDCESQLRTALQTISSRTRGAVVYLRQEGRGIGLGNKIRAYAEQARGADTLQANHILGFPTDLRDFTAAALILAELGVHAVHLQTNNPRKVRALRAHGIQVRDVRPSIATPNAHNDGYLRTKLENLGHLGLAPTVSPLRATAGGSVSGDRNALALDPRETLLVFDLDGVLQFGRRVHADAAGMVRDFRRAGFTLRFLTNDGFNSRASRLDEMRADGLEVEPHELYTSSYLAARYVENRAPILLLSGQPAADEFAHIPRARGDARTVVVGDWFHHYDNDSLQAAFEALEGGAELVAVHRKRLWTNLGRRLIDVGFWVSGLEHCTGRAATVVGKPSEYAYRAVLEDAGFPAHRAVMISDEADPDLRGAEAAGLHTVLFGDEALAGAKHASFGAVATYAELQALLRAS